MGDFPKSGHKCWKKSQVCCVYDECVSVQVCCGAWTRKILAQPLQRLDPKQFWTRCRQELPWLNLVPNSFKNHNEYVFEYEVMYWWLVLYSTACLPPPHCLACSTTHVKFTCKVDTVIKTFLRFLCLHFRNTSAKEKVPFTACYETQQMKFSIQVVPCSVNYRNYNLYRMCVLCLFTACKHLWACFKFYVHSHLCNYMKVASDIIIVHMKSTVTIISVTWGLWLKRKGMWIKTRLYVPLRH